MDKPITVSPILELQRQQLLLQMEYEEEKKAFDQKVDAIGMERRIARGDAWWPLSVGRSYYNSLNQLCVEVFRTVNNDEEQDHNFEYGKPVSFFTMTPTPNPSRGEGSLYTSAATKVSNNSNQAPLPSGGVGGGFASVGTKGSSKSDKAPLPSGGVGGGFLGIGSKCSVSFVDGNRMVVVAPDGFPVGSLCQQEGLGIQLSFDETSYRAMQDALERTMRAKGRLAYLRDLFYTPAMRAETYTFADMHFPYLNATQEHAVNEVLRAKDVAIVHGPPGTGKTTTLVEAIHETLRREPQVLVCAQSNMAVDWISERLVDRGINVLRIGNPTRVDDKMLSFTYERRFEAHPDYPQLWAIRKAIRELRANRKRGDQKFHQKLESLKGRAIELELRIQAELFGEARVIASTLVGSSNRLLDGRHFPTLFIDEAAQALEAACWIAIRRAGRVILAGDHCQLPPTVKCYEALKGGLGRTLMERIVEQKPEVVTLLTVQYRMHEDIMRFSSDWFYHNMVESHPSVRHRSILDLDLPMTWIDVRPDQTPTPNPSRGEGSLYTSAGIAPTPNPSRGEGSLYSSEGTEGNSGSSKSDQAPLPSGGVGGGFLGVASHSFSNEAEARLTLLALQAYFELIGRQRILDERLDVGIISPYRAQVQLLRQMLKKNEFLKPFRRLISVNTVDGFQGQERDIIVISLVRSNDEGQIGFLRDLRRMNVAITRARMKLIILGDRSTLCRHPFYRKLWQYIQALK